MTTRIEKDSFGELAVPKDALYGVHTQRSIQNFQISSLRWHPLILSSIVELKRACARANHDLNLLDAKKMEAIVYACHELLTKPSTYSSQFPLDLFQAGSGTSTNMNVNEVIANLASEHLGGKRGERSLVHPNDDVNKGQSTNNIIPSAIRMSSVRLLRVLSSELDQLILAFQAKGHEFSNVLKSGRTHLQDAVPITMGQEFLAYATALSKHRARLFETESYLLFLGVGGNAVGTGINTSPRFRPLIIEHLNKETGISFKFPEDGIEITQFLTDIAALSSVLKLLAIDLNKIANDLRLLASGPKTGFNEIILPAVEPGSSIMPGKINPSICEAVNMVCHYVIGHDTTITLSCASGNLELNTHMPIIGHCIVESLELMTHACTTFREKCIVDLRANVEQCRYYVEHSMALATALNPYIGYDRAAALVKESLATGKTLRELVLEKQYLTQEQVDVILDPKHLTSPNLK